MKSLLTRNNILKNVSILNLKNHSSYRNVINPKYYLTNLNDNVRERKLRFSFINFNYDS